MRIKGWMSSSRIKQNKAKEEKRPGMVSNNLNSISISCHLLINTITFLRVEPSQMLLRSVHKWV